jgi:hypothetical protein
VLGVGVAPGADEQATVGLRDLEPGAGVGLDVGDPLIAAVHRVVVDVVAMRERDMARIDPAFQRLNPVALLDALGDVAVGVGQPSPLEFGNGRLGAPRPHVGPQRPAPFHQPVGAELDPVLEPGALRL